MSAPLTYLFTDLVNSTALWEQAPDEMRGALAHHDELITTAVESHQGHIVKDTGDGVLAVFESPRGAVEAALEAQQAISASKWPEATGPFRVRMGMHTGESEARAGDYFGAAVNLAARIEGIAHGGQILITAATRSLIEGNLPAEVSLLGLGEHRLKGVPRPVEVFQTCHPSLELDFPPLNSLSTLAHNLPARVATFVGREHELANLRDRLPAVRLLTLTGAGGVGKTTLMLRLAEEVVDEYPNGVWLVELAALKDPELIPERIAAALNVPEQPGRAVRDAVVDFLRTKELLLLLDNVEHLVTGAAEAASFLLERCPSVTLMTTSREALLIDGEVTHRVPSLALPDPEEHSEAVIAAEAAQLFMDRAVAVRPDFEVTDENASVVAEIVRQLDGIPLALELAAARLSALTVHQIAERLDSRFRLLTGGKRTAVPRQQTLEAAIDWSWNLLTETEQLLLARLSVFSGGWSLEAAQSVTSDDRLDVLDVLDDLERLVEKSLVVTEFSAANARYRMLESIRQYANDRLAETGSVGALHRRHAEFFVAMAQEASPHLVGADMAAWVDRIVVDLDNLRAAVAWGNEHDVALSLQLSGSLLEYEVTSLTPRESRAWIEPAIEKARRLMEQDDADVPPTAFLRGLLALGMVQGMSGEPTAAAATFDECIARAKEVGEHRLLAHAVAMKAPQIRFDPPPESLPEIDEAITLARQNGFDVELAWLLWARGWLSAGEEMLGYYDEASELFRATGNPLFTALAERMRFQSQVMQDNFDEAKRFGLAWVEQSRATGTRRTITQSTSEVAHLLRRHGDFDEAEGYYRDAIRMWQELGHESAVAHQLECLAFIAIAKNEPERAATLLGAATETRKRLNAVSEDPVEIRELEEAKDQLAHMMGEAPRDAAITQGTRMDLDDAVRVAVSVQLSAHAGTEGG